MAVSFIEAVIFHSGPVRRRSTARCRRTDRWSWPEQGYWNRSIWSSTWKLPNYCLWPSGQFYSQLSEQFSGHLCSFPVVCFLPSGHFISGLYWTLSFQMFRLPVLWLTFRSNVEFEPPSLLYFIVEQISVIFRIGCENHHLNLDSQHFSIFCQFLIFSEVGWSTDATSRSRAFWTTWPSRWWHPKCRGRLWARLLRSLFTVFGFRLVTSVFLKFFRRRHIYPLVPFPSSWSHCPRPQ